MPPLAAFFAGAFVTLAVLAAVALAFGATASPFKHKARAFCKALMPRSISASSCFVLIQILLYESTRGANKVTPDILTMMNGDKDFPLCMSFFAITKGFSYLA